MLKLITSAQLPTKYGVFTMYGFEDPLTKENHIALTMGSIENQENLLVRVHSECLTGDVFGSIKCDCGEQLHSALELISKNKQGILIYHRSEGRGIGIINKIKAYALQDKGFDTVDANLKLGFDADERDFNPCAKILNLLKVKSIKLITNNPAKIHQLQNVGISINKTVPLIAGINKFNHDYLETKIDRMGHMLTKEDIQIK
ncbi:MAG: GTP cyclohydrolase II [Psittacicella sp.]